MNKQIINLYDHFKNTPKKLKIVCDWDEVIQPHEAYAWWEATNDELSKKTNPFYLYFKDFWQKEEPKGNGSFIKYSPYGSQAEIDDPEVRKKQQAIKNSPNFYQQAPFLTIAEDLLKLIKEDKVEKLIFLSAYDKRKFPNGDPRKKEIFKETFAKLRNSEVDIDLELIGFDSEKQVGKTKADWIRENASDFDIVIDDNPNICNSLVAKWFCKDCINRQEKWFEENKGKSAIFVPCENCIPMRTVIFPYYPATAKIATGEQEGYYRDVLLVKQEVGNLKKEDFVK